jgi:hypothetical protein
MLAARRRSTIGASRAVSSSYADGGTGAKPSRTTGFAVRRGVQDLSVRTMFAAYCFVIVLGIVVYTVVAATGS